MDVRSARGRAGIGEANPSGSHSAKLVLLVIRSQEFQKYCEKLANIKRSAYFCIGIKNYRLMTTFALNNLWTYLQGLSLSQDDREWLANKLIKPKEIESAETNNARLDEALKKFSGDFGGSEDAMTVAKELRQGAEMIKDVETW